MDIYYLNSENVLRDKYNICHSHIKYIWDIMY